MLCFMPMAVEFEEQEFARRGPLPQHGAVTSIILKTGLAKTPAQANIVLLLIAVLAIGLTVYLLLPERAAAPVPPPVGGLQNEPLLP